MPTRDDHDARRQRIAEAVWATVSAHGIPGTTMRRVAAVGGMSVGQIQHYFDSREQLLTFSCQAMVDRAAAGGTSATPFLGEPPDAAAALAEVRRLLVHALDASPAFRQGARAWFAYVAHAVVDEAIAAVVVEAQRGLVREVARLLAAAGRDPAHATALVALSEGLSQRTLTGAVDARTAAAEVDRALTRLAPVPASARGSAAPPSA